MRIFYRAIILACAILLMLFAVSNRETVSLALWPLPFLVDLPLYLLFFLSLLVGAVIGASAARIAGRGTRRELRRHRRRSEALERELAATHSQLTHARGREGRGSPPISGTSAASGASPRRSNEGVISTEIAPFGAMKGERIGREG
jgi:lipopolysaccharide assembly protein A